MYRQSRHQRAPLKTYDIHPISIKQIQKGHPWVTTDQYSEKFQPNERFIVAANRRRPFALLLHDPAHKSIRARVWATNGDFQKQIKNFKNDLAVRIKNAIVKRAKANYLEKRDHFYLIFAEGDNIPGILVHYLGGEILIQFYMTFWDTYKDYFIQTLIKNINDHLNEDVSFENIWIQHRSEVKQPAKCNDFNTSFKNLEISEFGIKYKVTLGKYYDHGIYTDMAAIREKIGNELANSKSVLNLFSYTGAFSLYALGKGAEDVVSVDLSENYLAWLDENIALNEEINKDKHTSMPIATLEALNEFVKNEKKFDFIISDPPSSSSDGNKRTNALADYKETLPLMDSILNQKGNLLVFINTHKVSMKKFEDRIDQIIKQKKLPLKVKSKFFLSEDCPHKKGFPEGSYLKGLLLTKND